MMPAADASGDSQDPEDRRSVTGDRESARIWIEQCGAARRIREAYGVDKALGYLIGEKLLTFLEAADRDPAFAAELPQFVKRSGASSNGTRSAATSIRSSALGPSGT
jgi:hypothetical protein